MIYLFAFTLAFCSIVYELLLGQALSAFLGNTVLRYSVTIGLYMLSMGIGALLAEGRLVRNPVTTLLRVEVVLTLVGGFSVLLLGAVYSPAVPAWLFSLFAHGLIVFIGILTGIEIPLLIELRHLETASAEHLVIGVDYLGAFIGTLVFAFFFYPWAGLIATAFAVAALNASVGVGLVSQQHHVGPRKRREYRALLAIQAGLFAGLVVCLANAGRVSETFVTSYLGVP